MKRNNFIGSLTSTSFRINDVHKTIETLKKQTTKLDILYLNLSKKPFNLCEGVQEIPDNLNKYIEEGFLKINWVDEIYGANRKFYPIIQQLKDTEKQPFLFFIFDDDLLYPNIIVEKMIESYSKYYNNDCIFGLGVHGLYYKDNKIISCKKDKYAYYPNQKRMDLWVNTGNGVLIPYEIINNYNYSKLNYYIKKYYKKLFADEIYLAIFLKTNNIPILTIDSKINHGREPIGSKWGVKYDMYDKKQELSLSGTSNYDNKWANWFDIEEIRNDFNINL